MNIKPFIGVSDFILGMSRAQVLSKYRKCDKKSFETYSDNSHEENWFYVDECIELSFQSEDRYLLSTVSIHADDALLDGKKIVGISEKQLLSSFPDAILDDDFEESGRCYMIEQQEIMLWLSDDKVSNVTVFPRYLKDGTTVVWPNVS